MTNKPVVEATYRLEPGCLGPDGAQYITGTLETSNGKFRVSILLRQNLIAQFRIENDND